MQSNLFVATHLHLLAHNLLLTLLESQPFQQKNFMGLKKKNLPARFLFTYLGRNKFVFCLFRFDENAETKRLVC